MMPKALSSKQVADPPSIRHDDVLALLGDPESSFFECPDGAKVRDSRYLRHWLCRDFHFPQILLPCELPGDFEVFPNCVLDVRQSLRFGGALRPAPGKARARDAVSLFGSDQSHWVLHSSHCSIAVEGSGNDVCETRGGIRTSAGPTGAV